MKCTNKQVDELMVIGTTDGWSISDSEGVLARGKSTLLMINALTAYLEVGYKIDSYTRVFSDNTLRIYIDK